MLYSNGPLESALHFEQGQLTDHGLVTCEARVAVGRRVLLACVRRSDVNGPGPSPKARRPEGTFPGPSWPEN